MSRLGKKCFFASVAFHTLLLTVLLVGVGFLSPNAPRPEPVNPVTVIRMLTDKASVVSGGSPEAHPAEAPATKAAVAPPAPPPEIKPVIKPEVKPEPQPEPPKVAVKPQPEIKPVEPIRETTPVEKTKVTPKPVVKAHHSHPLPPHDSVSVEPPKSTKKEKAKEAEPVVKATKPKPAAPVLDDADLKPVVHTTTTTPTPRPPRRVAPVPTGPSPAELEAAAMRKTITELAGNIGKTEASPIIKLDSTPGTSDEGPSETNYRDLVYSKYNAAWQPSADLDDDKSTVIASITIAPDGRVIGHEVVQWSRNRLMDHSIQAVLDRVTFIEPFPAGADHRPRTYLLKFNLQTKRAIG